MLATPLPTMDVVGYLLVWRGFWRKKCGRAELEEETRLRGFLYYHWVLPYMTSAQKGGRGGVSRYAANLRTNSIDFADKEVERGSRNPKIVWTSYMEAPFG